VENNIVNKVWKKYGKEYCEKSVKNILEKCEKQFVEKMGKK
jgi:hypothetical protein